MEITDEMISQAFEAVRQEAILKFPQHEKMLRATELEIDNSIAHLGLCSKVNGKIIISISRIYYKIYENRHCMVSTIRHEFAHAVSPWGEGHGKIWKQNAVIMGCPPKRHATNLAVNPTLVYEGKCCYCRGPVMLTKVRYNKWKKGQGFYMCDKQCTKRQ